MRDVGGGRGGAVGVRDGSGGSGGEAPATERGEAKGELSLVELRLSLPANSLSRSVACFDEVANITAWQLSKTKLLEMVTEPPPVLTAMPAPVLLCIRFLTTRMIELFQLEIPSPVAPLISLPSRVTWPPFATTLAPREE